MIKIICDYKQYYGKNDNVSLVGTLMIFVCALFSIIVNTFVIDSPNVFITGYTYTILISGILFSFFGYFYFKKVVHHDRFKILKKFSFMVSFVLFIILASPFILSKILLNHLGKLLEIETLINNILIVLLEWIMYLQMADYYLSLIQKDIKSNIIVLDVFLFMIGIKIIFWIFKRGMIGKRNYYNRFNYNSERRSILIYVFFAFGLVQCILTENIKGLESVLWIFSVFIILHDISEHIKDFILHKHINPILLNVIAELEFLRESIKGISSDQDYIMHINLSIKKYSISTYLYYIESTRPLLKNRYKNALHEINHFINKSYMMKDDIEVLNNDISKLLNDISKCFVFF